MLTPHLIPPFAGRYRAYWLAVGEGQPLPGGQASFSAATVIKTVQNLHACFQ
jgi:hypothetical protein